ncbi:carbonic anhydrase [Synchytrium endobioticum]|uniref:Carbonic anhydrase n=1 Tax=Synchytrium endobioticum TaxID=286115 RepID=A0A507CI67_9FUNG|nr:carbonic anhydrase [Synchytrium endobioticum]TPX53479.1 carbonic anhydrase [Synchytrium endobioticum]
MNSYDKDIESASNHDLSHAETADTVGEVRSETGPTRASHHQKQKSFNLLDSDNENVSPTLMQFRAHRPAVKHGNNDMSKFLSGFKKFQKAFFQTNKDLYSKLAEGQSPKTLLVGCCDSRVDPAMITGCDPGDLFVIRNVANLVAPYAPDRGHHGVSAALEFAVKVLKVENIVVLGHVQCGGIRALMTMKPDDQSFEFIAPWMSIAERAREKSVKVFGDKDLETQCRYCELASILVSLENLMTYPWVKERLMSGDLMLNGWYFDFVTGQLIAYNPASNEFETLGVEPDSPDGGRESAAIRKSEDGRDSIVEALESASINAK